MPKQGDMVQVKMNEWCEWSSNIKTFVCFYQGKVLTEDMGSGFQIYDQCRRLVPQEEVTLSDGKAYLVEERDGEKILKLKQ